jgi:dihydroneopterin aldolase
VYAYHGCLPEETKIGGYYEVTVRIVTDFSKAEKYDDLSTTIDYCDVFNIVVREMKEPSKLIEHVGGRIADALQTEIDRINKLDVTVKKIAPPMNGDVAEVSVIISR